MTTIVITECQSPWGKYWKFKVKGTGQKLAEVDKKRKSDFGWDGYVTYAGEWPSEVARHTRKATAMEYAKNVCREIVKGECRFQWNAVCEHWRWV